MNTLGSATLLLVVAAVSPVAWPQTPTSAILSNAERQEVLRQAREAHYSLRGAGLRALRCEVKPDWKGFFGQLRIDATGRGSIVPLLERTRFEVAVSADGSVTVTHTGVASPNAGMAASVRAAVAGMENMIAGFFKTWSIYALAAPLPRAEGASQIEVRDGQYWLRYHDGPVEIQTKLRTDLALEEVTYAGPELAVEMHPSWSSSAEGYLLTEYEGRTQMKPGEATELKMQIAYRPVEGLALPATASEVVPSAGGTVKVEFVFANYEVEKETPRREIASPSKDEVFCAGLKR